MTLRPVIAEGFAAAYGVALEHGVPDQAEQAQAEALVTSRYRAQSWLNERSAAADATGSALLRTPAGLARIYLTTHGDLVKSAMVVGDFNDLPLALLAMESALRWRRLDEDAIAAVVAASGAAHALEVPVEQIVAAVLEAGRQAVQLAAYGPASAPSGPASAPSARHLREPS
jgi:lipoate-protein ligase A